MLRADVTMFRLPHGMLRLSVLLRCSQCIYPLLEPVAQLVEHRTFNAVVAGSSPARLTKIFGLSDPFRTFQICFRPTGMFFRLSSIPKLESAWSFLIWSGS
jgi:hypothetical protein